MSGRIRSIKPELLEDAIVAGISDMAFRLFIACILLADDHGNLRYEPAWLKGQVFWKREVTLEEYFCALAELEPFVMAYTVKDQRYGHIRNWKKHQRVDKPGKPRVPKPPDAPETPSGESRETLANPSGESRETLAPDLRSPISDLDPDPEGDLPRARAHEVADAPEPDTPDLPPPDGPPALDAPLPSPWRARATAIVARTGVVDVNVDSSWRKYVAWLNEPDFQQPASEARWVRWVEDDCSAAARARKRQHDRDWSGPRLSTAPRGATAPYHAPFVPPEADEEPAPRNVALEASRRLAAGAFG